MGKQAWRKEQHRQERKTKREGLSLHDKILSPGLHERYALAATRILGFWRETQCSPQGWEQVDVAASLYLEHIFCEGYPKGFGSDGLAALQHFMPEVAGKLRHSWRLLKSWNKMEPPTRVLPISPLVVLAIGGACVRLRKIHCAAAFLLCFDTLLRPGELYGLRKRDITWAGGKAVISLRNTKTGQRKGAEEMVVCQSWIANWWLHRALLTRSDDEFLFRCTSKSLRTLFFALLEHIGLEGHFSMYSFRRGGATWHFLPCGSMEETLLRGRWQSTSTARIYLQDAAATLTHLQITPEQRSYMRQLSQTLSASSQRGVRGRY